ncbi:MAG: DUF1566 domain-containing protein [Opitutales bacterium]
MKIHMTHVPITLACIALSCAFSPFLWSAWPNSPIVDTGQEACYDEFEPIRPPKLGQDLYGQDAQYFGVTAQYTDNEDGTITDERTGLMWSRATQKEKLTLAQAEAEAQSMTLANYKDWRLPNIKELYSLIDFRGVTGMPERRSSQGRPDTSVPYINTDFFEFRYGNTDNGERFIDAQWLTNTINVSPVMHGMEGLFGVNFADGRIKCYPLYHPRRGKRSSMCATSGAGKTTARINSRTTATAPLPTGQQGSLGCRLTAGPA